MSNIQMGVLDLTSFMSYRFVGLALSSVTYAILKVLGIPVVNKVLLVYFVLAETYFYVSCDQCSILSLRVTCRRGSLTQEICPTPP